MTSVSMWKHGFLQGVEAGLAARDDGASETVSVCTGAGMVLLDLFHYYDAKEEYDKAQLYRGMIYFPDSNYVCTVHTNAVDCAWHPTHPDNKR